MVRFGILSSGFGPALVRVLPFAAYIALLALSKAIPDPFWSYTARIAVVSALLLAFAGHYVELRNDTTSSLRRWLFALGVGVVVFVLWINLDIPWFSFGQQQSFDPTHATGQLDWKMAAVRLFGAALVVPVMEELFWRSFLLRAIDKGDFLSVAPGKASNMALLASSLLFGFEHDLWFAGTLAGLAYGWLYMRTGSLWFPIVAHGLTNLMLGVWVISTGNWQFW
jgi:CAAX prenyl protease-like protein